MPERHRARILGVLLLLALALPTAAAQAQTPTAATVTRVVDGDTVEATLVTGQEITVRLIGRVGNRQFLSAWRMLGARRKAQVRPYWQWKAGL
jgi:phosphate-selective porin